MPKRRPIAVEETIEVQLGRHTLRGTIDLIVEDDTGATEIIDFKSGKAGSRKANESLQLYLYGRAWSQRHDVPTPVTSFYFLRHDDDKGFNHGEAWIEKKQVKSHLFDGDSAQTMKETVDALIAGILANQFEAIPSEDACRFCSYKRICPEAVR